MKKVLNYKLILLSCLLVSCGSNTFISSSNKDSSINNSSNNNNVSSNSSENKSSSHVDTSMNKLIISEYIEGDLNCAIELYNFSNEDVDLKDYTFNVYGSKETTPTNIIELNGTLKAKDTYVIVGALGDDQELKAKADLLSEKLLFSGRQALAVAYKGEVVDVVGIIGYNLPYAENINLVRKMNHTTPNTKFDEYDWIRYGYDEYQYLGTFEASVTEQDLLNGPMISDEFIDAPFFKEGSNNQIGGGGLAQVSVSSYVDGDTTCFNYPSYLGIEQGLKLRYQNINTPESYSGNIQEWGIPAKNYTKEQLSKANQIIIQSVKDGQIYETFNRLLGWVWVDGELLNFKIVMEGYSELRFDSIDTMKYKGVTYSNYLYHATLYAKRNGLKLHGEKDPTWDYDNWKSTLE